MTLSIRGAALSALVMLPPLSAAFAQGSPYLPLDDSRLPAIEHLIARGDIEDPSPMLRPFRRSDAVRVLAAADSAPETPSGRLIHRLLAELTDPAGDTRWRIEGWAGPQAYTHARRDPLHPAGAGGARPYAELRLEAVLGNLVLVSRPAVEPRLIRDPDWQGRKNLQVTGRHVEGYLSGQFRWADIYYGQMARQWGPAGVPGIGLSAESYPRPEIGFDVHTRDFRLDALAADLQDGTDSLGQLVHRYFFAHRLSAKVSKRLYLALWETTVLSGVDRRFDGRYRNPVTLLLLANEYGLGDNGNVLLGIDARWRVHGRTTLEAQLGIDDIQYKNRGGPTRTPDRYAFTVAMYGPFGGRAAWRALYSQASSLAFRTIDPFDNFTDQGVGIGRNFADNDQLSLYLTFPATPHWLLTPELTLLRQGQGRIDDPFPALGLPAGSTPVIFIGTVEHTWRAALGLSGRQGPFDVTASAGFHHVTNAFNLPGRTVNRFEGRITATIGFIRTGAFH
jgi:hypothetical protein